MKKLLFFSIFISLFGIVHAQLPAEHYLFRKLDAKSALPDNKVRNSLMLPDGMMCIKTAKLLSLYDGSVCHSYRYDLNRVPYSEYNGMEFMFYDGEDRLWLKNRDHIWMFNLRTHVFEYDVDESLKEFGIKEPITDLYIDAEYNYYLTTQSGVVYCCSAVERKTYQLPRMSAMSMPLMMVRKGDMLWILCDNGTLAGWDTSVRRFVCMEKGMFREHVKSFNRIDMVVSEKEKLFMMYEDVLLCYDIKGHSVAKVDGITLTGSDLLTTIALDGDGNLWVGSSKSGVRIIDTSTLKITSLPFLQTQSGEIITHNSDISKIYIDPDGGLWISTELEGMFYYHDEIIKFELVDSESVAAGRMNDENIKCMLESEDGKVLLGTVNGLLSYDPVDKSVSVPYPELAHELCISLYQDRKGNIWLGTFGNGAFRIGQGGIRHYRYENMPPVSVSYHDSSPNKNSVRGFYEDARGTFWVSVYGSAGIFDESTGEIELLRDRFPEVSQFLVIREIVNISPDRLLFAGDNGQFVYNQSTDRIETDEDRVSMGCNQCLYDSRGVLWLAADGLIAYDSTRDRTYVIGINEGLPDENVYGIVQDDFDDVWVSTSSGLSRIDVVDGADGTYQFNVTNFTTADGIQGGSFFQHSVIKTHDGSLWFGGAQGVNIIRPYALTGISYITRPTFVGFRIYNTRINVGDHYKGHEILNESISQTRHITLKHNESFVTFEFSGLNFVNPTHMSYRYKLENFDEEWNEVQSSGGLGQATYTLLRPGDYIFKVYSSVAGGEWSRECAELILTVRPPFWRSTWAMILYSMLLITIVFMAVHHYLKRSRERDRLQKERELQRQKEEMEQMKYRFFTNISHDLRTPLSLILIPLETLIENNQFSAEVREQLNVMLRNAKSLMQMVNHLLDFRKLEMKGEKLKPANGNIVEFMEEVCSLFNEMADARHLNYTVESKTGNLYMAFDPNLMRKVVNNLLSNAFKFTPEGGTISVMLSKEVDRSDGGGSTDMFVLTVADSGIGIPQSELGKIFDRFYQCTNHTGSGSGIGLSIIKQYVDMHGGTIGVESSEGCGSAFTVRIPVGLHSDDEADTLAVMVANGSDTAEPSNYGKPKDSKVSILIVEDNIDFRRYIAGILGKKYKTYEAPDGKAGLDSARKHQPDLIISDAMMPNMDGFEMCKVLKKEISTSHIPIILLTARTSDDVRQASYDAGADAYLTKPFKLGMLFSRINNLIEEHKKRIVLFSTNPDSTPSQIAMSSLDETLIKRAMDAVEKNIADPEYSVEALSNDMNMHRMSFYRKLQSIVGQTPAEFIRTVRIRRAAQLLKENRYTISEVAVMVGFNTLKYFVKYFKENFSMTPSQYARQFKEVKSADDENVGDLKK